MDKIKLFSQDRHAVPEHVIDKYFEPVKATINYPNNNYRNSFMHTSGINLDRDGFGCYLTLNPTKFLNGNNLQQIDYRAVKRLKIALDDILQIDVDTFRITGLDFNQDIFTNQPVKHYIPIFRNVERYHIAHSSTNGITFKNTRKTIGMYDKVEQMRKAHELVPPDNLHRLRIELGIDSRFTGNKNLAQIKKLSDLSTPDNYNQLVDEWSNAYHQIKKQSVFTLSGELRKPPEMSLKDFKEVFYINAQGMENYLTQIDLEPISTRQKKRQKDAAQEFWNRYTNSAGTTDLLQELNQKVADRIKILKSTCDSKIIIK